MKRIILVILAIAALCSCAKDTGKPKAKHVIFIGVDGVSTPVFKNPETLKNIPNLKMMMDNGSYTLTKRAVMPSASAINWASIFNGLPTEQHGYYRWNSEKPDIPAITDNGRGMPPTIFTLIREQRPSAETGCAYNWDGIGPVVDTTVINYHIYDPGYHNPENYVLEEYVKEKAVKYILEKKPDFFTFYIGDVDETGHTLGWETQDYYDCIANVDKMIGLIIQATKDAGIFDDTIFVFTTDHGGSENGHGQFLISHLETPFIIYGKNIRKGTLGDSMMQYDVPATMAYALGLDIPKEWRGRPMKEAFK